MNAIEQSLLCVTGMETLFCCVTDDTDGYRDVCSVRCFGESGRIKFVNLHHRNSYSRHRLHHSGIQHIYMSVWSVCSSRVMS